MKYRIFIGALLAAIAISLGLVSPSYAVDPTFTYNELDDEAIELHIGSNLLLAGKDVVSNQTVNGLLFSAGNNLGIRSESDYAFVAGNLVTFSATTAKDIFVAGNNILISSQADIGRDAFLTGNAVTVESDLSGNLSVAANKVTLNNIDISGNVDLSVSSLVIEGDVHIGGKLSYNSDTNVIGLDRITYAELETYEKVDHTVDTATYLVSQVVSILGLVITMIIILAISPRLDHRIAHELSTTQLGKDILIGLCTLILTPLIVVLLLTTFIGAPAALVLLGLYIIAIYLAQAFSGYWLGKLIVEQALHGKLNKFLEAFIGIVTLGILRLIPFIGYYLMLASIMLGLGLILQSIKPHRQSTRHHHRVPHQDLPETKQSNNIDQNQDTESTASDKSTTDTAMDVDAAPEDTETDTSEEE